MLCENVSGGIMSGCAACLRPICDRYFHNVNERNWHSDCTRCSVCKKHLDKQCMSRDGLLYCREDYNKCFAPKCSTCFTHIQATDLVHKLKHFTYHTPCLRCHRCNVALCVGDTVVILDDGALLCREDYQMLLLNSPVPGGPGTDFYQSSSTESNFAISSNTALLQQQPAKLSPNVTSSCSTINNNSKNCESGLKQPTQPVHISKTSPHSEQLAVMNRSVAKEQGDLRVKEERYSNKFGDVAKVLQDVQDPLQQHPPPFSSSSMDQAVATATADAIQFQHLSYPPPQVSLYSNNMSMSTAEGLQESGGASHRFGLRDPSDSEMAYGSMVGNEQQQQHHMPSSAVASQQQQHNKENHHHLHHGSESVLLHHQQQHSLMMEETSVGGGRGPFTAEDFDMTFSSSDTPAACLSGPGAVGGVLNLGQQQLEDSGGAMLSGGEEEVEDEEEDLMMDPEGVDSQNEGSLLGEDGGNGGVGGTGTGATAGSGGNLANASSGGGNGASNSSTKRRGPRTTIKAKQLDTLKAAFAATPKPTRHVREQLAQETGLTMRVIQVWFQNRRSKERRMKQLNLLGSRRPAYFRGSRRIRSLRSGLVGPEEIDFDPELLANPAYHGYLAENHPEFYNLMAANGFVPPHPHSAAAAALCGIPGEYFALGPPPHHPGAGGPPPGSHFFPGPPPAGHPHHLQGHLPPQPPCSMAMAMDAAGNLMEVHPHHPAAVAAAAAAFYQQHGPPPPGLQGDMSASGMYVSAAGGEPQGMPSGAEYTVAVSGQQAFASNANVILTSSGGGPPQSHLMDNGPGTAASASGLLMIHTQTPSQQ